MRRKLLAMITLMCFMFTLVPVTALAADSVPNVNGNWIDEADTSWYNDTDTEFTIGTAAELAGLASLVNKGNTFENKKISLGADIDLAGKNWTPIGGYGATYSFGGVFDGNHHTISNLIITNVSADVQRLGLFAKIQSDSGRVLTAGYVHSLTLKDTYISTMGTNVRVGALTAILGTNGTIREVVIDGFTYVNTANCSTDIAYIGGLAGYVSNINTYEEGREIENNVVKNVNITAYGVLCIGGVFGYVSGWAEFWNTDAENISINATSSVAHPQNDYAIMAGGFFGLDAFNNGFDYKDCDVKNVAITLNGTSKFVAGGFGGQALGGSVWATDKNIDTCSAQGKITNNGTSIDTRLGGYYGVTGYGSRVFDGSSVNVNINSSAGVSGGFIGNLVAPANSGATQNFKNCMVSGSVSSNIAGGFIGYINSTTYIDNINIYKTCALSSSVTGSNVENAIVNPPKEYYLDTTSNNEKYVFAPAVAWATVNGVDIGFATVKEAIDSNNESVTLLNNIVEDIAIDNNFTLNLDKFTLSGTVTMGDVQLTVTGTSTGNKIVLPTLEKVGYTFDGWYDGDTKAENNTITEAGVYNVRWVSSIILDANGGEVNPDSAEVAEGAAIGTLPTPIRSGYTFEGWYTESTGGTKIEAATIPEGNAAYYAHWTGVPYAIHFDLNGGTGTTPSALDMVYGTVSKLPSNDAFRKADHYFAGWNTQADGQGVTYVTSASNLTTTANDPVTLYAVWSPKPVLTPTVEKQEYVYTGQAQTYALDGGYTIAYQQDGQSVTPIHAGVYDVVITKAESDDYAAYYNTAAGTLEIIPAKLTAAYMGDTIKEGGQPELAVAVTGFVNGETAATAEHYIAPTVVNHNTAVGTYQLTPAGGNAGDYTFVYEAGTLTILPAKTTVNPGDTVYYMVEHYKESPTVYELTDTEYLAGKIGDTVTAVWKEYDSYTRNEANSTTSAQLKALTSDGDIAILQLYYDAVPLSAPEPTEQADGTVATELSGVFVGAQEQESGDSLEAVTQNKVSVDVTTSEGTVKDAKVTLTETAASTIGEGNASLAIKADAATVAFDGNAMQAIGNAVTANAQSAEITIAKAQQKEVTVAGKAVTSVAAVEVDVTVNGQKVLPSGGSNNAKITITVKTDLAAGSKAYIYYVNGGALTEEMISDVAADGWVTFEKAHLSTYAIFGETAVETAQPDSTPTTGSSSFSGVYNYPVTVMEPTNGTAKADKFSAVEGAIVTITTSANAGYGVYEVIVTDADGDSISVTNLNNGQYTFTMPNSAAKVQVVYEAAITMVIDSEYINVFGKTIKNDAAPIIRDSRTMLPIRVIAEALGADVDWNADTQKVTIIDEDTVIELYIGKTVAYINGELVQLDTAAFIDNSRTYLPVRFISEALDAMVNWDAVTRTVTVIPE